MAQKIIIQHPVNGLTTNGYYGFSWTYLFFGGFVPLFRGEVLLGLIHLILSICTFGMSNVVFCFLYNKQYMIRMIEKGYILKDSEENMRLARIKLGIAKLD